MRLISILPKKPRWKLLRVYVPNLLPLSQLKYSIFLKKQHLSALPLLSPSSRAPAGKSAETGEEHEDTQVWIAWSPMLLPRHVFLATKTLCTLSFHTPCGASHPSSNYSYSPAVKAWWRCCAHFKEPKAQFIRTASLVFWAYSLQACTDRTGSFPFFPLLRSKEDKLLKSNPETQDYLRCH